MSRLGSEEDGFTLVELLVVMLMIGVVGGIVVTGVTRGMRTTTETQNRVEALTATQTAIERASREMRAADPVRSVTDDHLTLDVHRDGELHHYRYSLQADGDEWTLRQERWVFTDPATFDATGWEPAESDAAQTSTRSLVQHLVDNAVFTAYDALGNQLSGEPVPNALNTERLTVTVRRAIQDDREPIQIQTSVTVRN